MWSESLNQAYFEWLIEIGIGFEKYERYSKLIHALDGTDFIYTIPLDGNRFEDGIALRYRYGIEECVDESEIASVLDIHPCTMLEMMIALAFRVEESIMSNADDGDRTKKWFWIMIDSLGLSDMTNDHFDMEYFQSAMDRLTNHMYERDGSGGLFTIPNSKRDMRTAEIWYQANWYLVEVEGV